KRPLTREIPKEPRKDSTNQTINASPPGPEDCPREHPCPPKASPRPFSSFIFVHDLTLKLASGYLASMDDRCRRTKTEEEKRNSCLKSTTPPIDRKFQFPSPPKTLPPPPGNLK
uniref:Uncharacterized protein n=1 Tax=Aegilops tauschii subsp. strangulata TaxID=200361 RepID=A0A452XMU8_AEGTS